jgi:signal-transduction protein with cAMP-binding, CBS, and nucleotidyltransferase domain
MAAYSLCKGRLPGNEPDWLEALETWSQRSRSQVAWITKQSGGQWIAKISRRSMC